jgi:hypothetical protein
MPRKGLRIDSDAFLGLRQCMTAEQSILELKTEIRKP